MDYNNSFKQNRIGRWYNEYKNFKESYCGEFDEEDMVDYFMYRNVYRLYVFDISKQVEAIMSTGIAKVQLEFNFKAQAVNPPATMVTNLYVVSFYDIVLKLKSDGWN